MPLTQDQQRRISACCSSSEGLTLMYMWVKQGQLSSKDFKLIFESFVSSEVKYRLAQERKEA
jgi:hypothetical protein